jgi:hypothetical protein
VPRLASPCHTACDHQWYARCGAYTRPQKKFPGHEFSELTIQLRTPPPKTPSSVSNRKKGGVPQRAAAARIPSKEKREKKSFWHFFYHPKPIGVQSVPSKNLSLSVQRHRLLDLARGKKGLTAQQDSGEKKHALLGSHV